MVDQNETLRLQSLSLQHKVPDKKNHKHFEQQNFAFGNQKLFSAAYYILCMLKIEISTES